MKAPLKTLLALIIGITSCNQAQEQKSENIDTTACVEKVLAIDDSLGTIRNHQCEQIPLSSTIDNYASSLRAIDFSNCPKPFKQAFDKHIQAWVDMKEVTDKYPDKRGELHDLFDEIKLSSDSVQFSKYLDEIWGTWREIEENQGLSPIDPH